MKPVYNPLIALALVASVLVAFATSAVSADKPRFRFCRDADINTCNQPGRGYTMCERFLKALNNLPRNEPPPVCDIKLPSGFEEFQSVKWEPMQVAENMRLIYDMEMYLVVPNERDYSQAKWPQYFTHEYWSSYETGKSLTRPETWRRVPYKIWLADYQERMRKGEVEPRISRIRAVLNERGPQDLIRYEFKPGGDVAECHDTLTKIGYAEGSEGHIFVLTGNPKLPIKAIFGHPGSTLRSMLLLYRGRAVFVSTEDSMDGGFGWSLQISVASPPLPPKLDEGDYVFDTRCDFRLNK